MSFFRGTPDGKNSHDDLAEKIGMQGKIWARDHVRPSLFELSCLFVARRLTPLRLLAVAETRYGWCVDLLSRLFV